jgi:hypothetical protein
VRDAYSARDLAIAVAFVIAIAVAFVVAVAVAIAVAFVLRDPTAVGGPTGRRWRPPVAARLAANLGEVARAVRMLVAALDA